MNFKTLVAAAAIVAFTGPALAQTTSATTSNSAGQRLQPTQGEMTMFEANPELWSGFFTDDTWMTPRSEAEITAAWSAMNADQQAEMKAACEEQNADASSGQKLEAGTQSMCAMVATF